MVNLRAAAVACLFAGQFGLSVAHAKPNDELATRFTKYSALYALNDDGSYVETRSVAMAILNDRALQWSKQRSITYSTSIQKAEVLEAYTQKPDGRRVEVPKSNYQVEINGGRDKGAAVFSDQTTMTVVFPDLAKGDTTVFTYRLTATQPMFPGQFSVMETFPKQVAYDELTIKIDAPMSVWSKSRLRANQLRESSVVEHDGRKSVQWSWDNRQPEKEERRDWSVYERDQDAGLAFSTFQGYGDIASAYGSAARPKAVVTSRIQKLADDIAKDSKTPRDTARLLYTWVARNITYAGNCVGLGAVVPRDTDFVLDNHMGDCKDHATLLQALLAAKGIQSTQALVNAGASYRLPAIPVVSMVNHVINYIPSLDLYLDSTSDEMPFGMLPYQDQDKPVLLVDGYRDGTKTPASPVGSNQQVMKTVVNIQPDGSAKGEVSISLKGMFAVSSRGQLRALDKSAQADLVKKFFEAGGYTATGTFTTEDPTELIDTHKFGVSYEVGSLYTLPGSGALAIQPMFWNTAGIAAIVGAEAQRQIESVPVSCFSGRSVEEYIYTFPPTVKIVSVPPTQNIAEAALSYTATYVRKGQTLTVRRVLEDRTPGNVCTPEVMSASKQFAQKVMLNLRAQVIYR